MDLGFAMIGIIALLIYVLVILAVAAFAFVVQWKVYKKAGQPGWACFVPFYNEYVQFKIAFGNGWWFLMLFVPIANIVFSIMLVFRLAKAFGKGVGFGFGLLFLSLIFLAVIAFDDTITYHGPIPM